MTARSGHRQIVGQAGHLLSADQRLWRAAQPLDQWSIEELRRLADVGEKTARGYIMALVEAGYVLVQRKANGRRGEEARFTVALKYRHLQLAPTIVDGAARHQPLACLNHAALVVRSRRVA